MDAQDLIRYAGELAGMAREISEPYEYEAMGVQAECMQFLRDYAGPESSFCELAKRTTTVSAEPLTELAAVMDGFADYVKKGLHGGLSLERQAQLDAVSDFLGQANSLLQEKGVHPAAAAMVIGASLEEFLRTWVETDGLRVGGGKPGINSYVTTLLKANRIKKQDVKDITAWAGIRNHAAHGEWDEVSDGKRIELMLENVNLFMRKYGAE